MVSAGVDEKQDVRNHVSKPHPALTSNRSLTWQQRRPGGRHTPSEGSTLFWWLGGAVTVLLFAILLSSDTLFYVDWAMDENAGGNAMQNRGSLQPPPVRKYADNEKSMGGMTDHQGEADGTPGSVCFTLEQYSERFVESLGETKQNQWTKATASQRFYRCGTRLMDLEIELNHTKVKLCSVKNTPTLFPALRVYLNSAFEEQLHIAQRQNVAAQIIPLERLNDDYCDCLDGTDELQTNACSMSGAISPLSHKMWKQYLTANAHVRLYEEEEAPSSRRTERLLHRLGGPVLPFRCRGDPDVWLAPSRVNDGVMDCCDGSDELQGAPQKQRKSRVVEMAQYLNKPAGDTSLLHPTPGGIRTVAGMLLDKDLTSLMTCRRVKEERLRDARTLHKIVKEGHMNFKVRKANGWKHYGRDFVENNAQLQLELKKITSEFEELRSYVNRRMMEAKVDNPLAAGISNEEIETLMRLYTQSQQQSMRFLHARMILQHRWLGDDFEFYPLVNANYTIPLRRVVDTAHSSSAMVQEWMTLRRLNHTQNTKPHVDNVFYDSLVFFPYLYIAGIQRSAGEGTTILRSHSRNVGETEKPHTTREGNDYGQTVVMAHWQPDRVELSLENFTSVDPAGSTVLRKRLLISDPLPIMGGFEQILPHERLSHEGRRRRVLRIETSRTSEERLKNALSGIKDEETVEVMQHGNTPDFASVQVFHSGLSCALPGTEDESTQHTSGDEGSEGGKVRPNKWMTQGRVVFVCAVEDGLLEWHRNGRCAHEVVFGTPSACPLWTLEKAAVRLEKAEKA